MVGIDIGVFYHYQIPHHLVAGHQTLSQQLVHNLNDLLSQSLEPLEFGKVNLSNDPSKFLVDKLNTL
jgi:hypothetical protein